MTTTDPAQEILDESQPGNDPGSAADSGPPRQLRGWVVTIAIAAVLTVLLKSFLLQAYSIPSESMVPTLKIGDRVLVFRLDRDPSRGDIVVFDRPPNDPKTNESDPDVLIKRVIGLPGGTIDVVDGRVRVGGTALDED